MNNGIIFSMGTYTYVAKIEQTKEGVYVANFPSLPGCVTQGNTLEDVVVMAKDALTEYISARKDLGWSIPLEKASLLKSQTEFVLPVSVAIA